MSDLSSKPCSHLNLHRKAGPAYHCMDCLQLFCVQSHTDEPQADHAELIGRLRNISCYEPDDAWDVVVDAIKALERLPSPPAVGDLFPAICRGGSLLDKPEMYLVVEVPTDYEIVIGQKYVAALTRVPPTKGPTLDSSRCCPANTPEQTEKCKAQNGVTCSAFETSVVSCPHGIDHTVTTDERGVWLCRKCGTILRDSPSEPESAK